MGFYEEIICAGGDIPSVGMFTRKLIIEKISKWLVREGNEWFPFIWRRLYSIPEIT